MIDFATAIVAIIATVGTFWIVILGKDIPQAIVAIDTTIFGFLFGRGTVQMQTINGGNK